VSIDDRLDGDVMCVRKSMDKFYSSHTNIEICSWSKPIPAHLNKQAITILSALGIPDEVFIQAQNEALQKIASVNISSNCTTDVRHGNQHYTIAFYNIDAVIGNRSIGVNMASEE
jgi:hypothetical protein